MSWRELAREKTRHITFVTWRCSHCGKLAAGPDYHGTPTKCCCLRTTDKPLNKRK